MIEDLLKEIVSTEDEWDGRVRTSVVTSKDIVSAAAVEAIKIEKDCRAQIKVADTANVAKAEKDANVLKDEILQAADKDAATIIKDAKKLSSSVSKDIIGRLGKKYA